MSQSDTQTHLHDLRPRAYADSVGVAALCHLVHEHASLIASDQYQLAEQRLSLEGYAEHATIEADRLRAGTHQERRGCRFRQDPERADFIIVKITTCI